MCDDWLNAWFPFHSDCVNLPVIDLMFRAVILRGIKHMLLFDSSDIFFSGKNSLLEASVLNSTKIVTSPCFTMISISPYGVRTLRAMI
jgi:hypothetical protein